MCPNCKGKVKRKNRHKVHGVWYHKKCPPGANIVYTNEEALVASMLEEARRLKKKAESISRGS
jgi:hypothetical protein